MKGCDTMLKKEKQAYSKKKQVQFLEVKKGEIKNLVNELNRIRNKAEKKICEH